MPVLIDKTISVYCEGPRCKDKPPVIWNEAEVARDVNAFPDAAVRFLTLLDFTGQEKHIFCGPTCVKEWLGSEYTPPLSPKERATQEAKARATAAPAAEGTAVPAPASNPEQEKPSLLLRFMNFLKAPL